jgi:hypothetical protein
MMRWSDMFNQFSYPTSPSSFAIKNTTHRERHTCTYTNLGWKFMLFTQICEEKHCSINIPLYCTIYIVKPWQLNYSTKGTSVRCCCTVAVIALFPLDACLLIKCASLFEGPSSSKLHFLSLLASIRIQLMRGN